MNSIKYNETVERSRREVRQKRRKRFEQLTDLQIPNKLIEKFQNWLLVKQSIQERTAKNYGESRRRLTGVGVGLGCGLVQ